MLLILVFLVCGCKGEKMGKRNCVISLLTLFNDIDFIRNKNNFRINIFL